MNHEKYKLLKEYTITKNIENIKLTINNNNNDNNITFYLNIHKNVCIPYWLTSERLEFLNKIIQLDKKDIIICTYPKSGTTFLEQIVLLLENGIKKKDYVNPVNRNSYQMENKFGKIWIESLIHFKKEEYCKYNADYIPEGEYIDYDYFVNEIGSPRIIKTHASLDLLLDKESSDRNKIIIISRNPLDTCVSHYYHFAPIIEKKFNIKLTFDIWALLWLEGLVPFGCWFEWTKTWYKKYQENFIANSTANSSANIMWIYYEDLVSNPESKIREISNFLEKEKEIKEDELLEIVKESSFKNMSEQMLKADDFSNKFNHLRKGIIGDWRNHFDDAMHKKFVDKFLCEMKGLDLKYFLGNDEYLTCPNI